MYGGRDVSKQINRNFLLDCGVKIIPAELFSPIPEFAKKFNDHIFKINLSALKA